MKLSPHGAQQHFALPGDGVGHGNGQFVAAGGSGEGEPDTGVTAGGFDDDAIRVQFAFIFCGIDHGNGDAVLDAVGGIEIFQFGEDGGMGISSQAVDPDQGGVAGCFCYVIINFHNFLS